MKKKMISMLLALTLVVTGIPSGITVNAAEITDDVENAQMQTDELHPEADNLYAFNVSEDGKAVGSDAVVYDDVVYLSADTVNALNTNAQNAYFEFCDDIAYAKSCGDVLEDVVVAVDGNGELVFHYSIPIKELSAAMNAFSRDWLDDSESVQDTEAKETDTAQQAATEENTQAEDETETVSEEEAAEETATQVTDSEETSDNEAATEEASIEEPVSEEESISAEETASVEETVLEEETLAPGENMTEEASVENTETVTEEETESIPETFVLTEENMDLIPKYEEEHFSVAEDVKADLIVDLGYDTSEIKQNNSILPNDNWFRDQLNDEQKKIFDASKVMGKGTNKFRLTASSKLGYADFCQAVSAYIMTEPYKCDWMDLSKTGIFSIKYSYHSKNDPTYNFEVTVGKSRYYNDTISNNANAKVLQLAEAAQEYALKNYPSSPVYGIVKYFDNWICENNYYNDLGVTGGSSDNAGVQEIYYYCHSSYGILLKGSGVCESYALAMTRLLDAVGIPNMYATGDAGGGHAWNYVQMPNGNWYLQDSTWNDTGANEAYLLCADDGIHIPMGNRYVEYTDVFRFVTRASSSYKPENEKEQMTLSLSQTELNLLPKKTAELTVLSGTDNAYASNGQLEKVWSSSNPKVAKVDANGKVTAVSAGSAKITLTMGMMTGTCIVNVHQINSITFENGGKTSLTTSVGIESGENEDQHILLKVNQAAADPMYTAEELQTFFNDFNVKSSNEAVAKISEATTISGNTIDLAIAPKGMGKTTITVTFGAKKATLKLSVSEKLHEEWFDLTQVKQLQDNANLMYTGKAYKPKVALTTEGKAKKVKFKVTYKNNKDAGTASVVIAGTGSYGGELVYEFTINPLELNPDTSAVRATSKAYNGGVNPAKVTIRHINEKNRKVSLKAGKDYDIEYTKAGAEGTTQPIEAGEYTMKVVGKGNYTGSAVIGKTYTITPIDIRKVKVTVKVNGTKPAVTVAIGKNVLPETDYDLTFYKDKKCTQDISVNSLESKKQYYVKVEGTGSNLTNVKPIVKSFKTK